MDNEVTVKEAADLLRLSIPMIIKLIHQGHLNAYKITDGTTSPYRISRESITRYDEKRKASYERPAA